MLIPIDASQVVLTFQEDLHIYKLVGHIRVTLFTVVAEHLFEQTDSRPKACIIFVCFILSFS
jgi:hypothetical protein